jgi:hypothetical protein
VCLGVLWLMGERIDRQRARGAAHEEALSDARMYQIARAFDANDFDSRLKLAQLSRLLQSGCVTPQEFETIKRRLVLDE